jgi:hypothetical protein
MLLNRRTKSHDTRSIPCANTGNITISIADSLVHPAT